jgi:acyl transferase domain-containing protein/acyl carrier protein
MGKDMIPPQEDVIEEIAVIGLSGRFPGARDLDQFWQNLRDGVESIAHFTDQELEALGIPSEWLKDPNYVKAGTVLEDFDKFDAMFFGYSPKEAEDIDPQQRIFLETAWEALENAGYNPETFDGPIGVFAGSNPNDYLSIIPAHSDVGDSAGALERLIGNEKDFLCTRVSYKFNLRGPSITVQTGCSTSLVAVQLACQSLLNYQCNLALAGGVSINLRHSKGYFYQEGMIPSPDGRCRAFDADARGTVLSQGVGAVVLKRLSEALSDGDTIHAVIKGVAINNDGALKASYTAPSVDGQAEVIAMAHALSGVPADSVGYIEAHGTGTPLGDPIEIAALTQAFRASTQKKEFCAIGSVKTNIGHADAAAGIAGLIKTILMLKHKQIPPSLHFKRPNPNIDFENSPLFVPTELSEWCDNGFPRRAGVSSFGVGGTNVHAVLEEAPAAQPSGRSRPWQLLLISAQTSNALGKATANLVEHLKNNPQQNLSDIVYTLHTGRKALNYRRMAVCKDRSEAIRRLETPDQGLVLNSYQEPVHRDVVFMFSGQGAQYINMGLELYRTESVFRKHIDHCSKMLRSHLSLDLRDLLYPGKGSIEELVQQLKQTSITQPALFTVEYALAKLWMSWGVHPAAMVGHSIGEYVAACLAGVFSPEDALSLVATRGRLMQQQPAGSMLAVQLSEKDIQCFLNQRLSLAAVNAPSYCVVSGEKEAIAQLENDLGESNIAFTLLHTSHAFHSDMMEPILDAFKEQVGQVRVSPPQIPFLSNLTGTWITPEEAVSPSYWARHLRHTVRFSSCVLELLKDPDRIFLEVGPGQTLSTFAKQHSDGSKGRVVLSSLRHPKEEKSDVAFILNTLGRLWLAGVQVDWSGFYKGERRHRIPLPTYPFERQRYWPEKAKLEQLATIAPRRRDKRLEMKEWFYVPSWKRSQLPNSDNSEAISNQNLSWLIFLDEYGLGDRFARRLEQEGHRVATVKPGEVFHNGFEGTYTINPKERGDYHRLLKELRAKGCVPNTIVHLFCLTGQEESSSNRDPFEVAKGLGFDSLVFLAQAMGNHLPNDPICMKVFLNNLYDVTGDENLSPEKAIVLGPCRVIPQEYSHIKCSIIDIKLPKSDLDTEELQNLLIREIAAKTSDPVIAYRGKHRWVQIFEPFTLEKEAIQNPRIKQNGVYLITGGLGGIGLVLAEYLVQRVQAKLILVSRRGLPERNEWEQWIKLHGEEDSISRKIRKVKSMEEVGAEVLILTADVTDLNQMKSVFVEGLDRFGQIHGVIHAAGIAGGGIIQLKTPEVTEGILAPKVKGTLVLDSILNGVNLDFFVLCSALDSILGEVGQVDYCAANAFLDAYAQKYHSKKNVMAVNWCTWQEVGMAVETEVPQDLKGKRERSLKFGLAPNEGKEAFSRVLNSSLPQVLVSTRDLSFVIEESKGIQGFGSVEKTAEAPSDESMHPRPTLSSEYVAPGNPMEQTIAGIWQELLKIEKVGIHDNFFELGGHSLMALQILARLKNKFPNQFSAATLFERPTVYLLSRILLEMQQGGLFFEESSRRGQKRKERRLQRMIHEKGQE